MRIKTIIKWFDWCFTAALNEHGAHTGGPFEYQHAKNCRMAERALKELKKYKNYDNA